MSEERGETVRLFLAALRDSDELKQIKKRLLHISSEKFLSTETLSLYRPGEQVLKEQARQDIAKQIGMFLLDEGHINFSEYAPEENMHGGSYQDRLCICGTLEIVKPR